MLMNRKRILPLVTALLMLSAGASAQGLLGKLKDKAVKAGQKKVEQVVTKKAEQVVEGAVTPTADEQTATSDTPARTTTEETGTAADAVNVEAPNPYTKIARPSHSIPLGLPQNDNGAAPTGMPAECVSYSAYEFDPVKEDLNGDWSKVFYNATNKRHFTITYHDDGKVSKSLIIPDSAAFYMINDEKKTIQRFSMAEQGQMLLNGMDDAFVEGKTERTADAGEIVRCDGRWCFRKTYKAKSTGRGGTSENTSYSYFDMETGIKIRQDVGNQNFLRGIHLGLSYPELFELPKDYKMVNLNFGPALEMLKKSKQQK